MEEAPPELLEIIRQHEENQQQISGLQPKQQISNLSFDELLYRID
jgi:hypothetical protein